MAHLAALGASVALVALTCVLHCEVLRWVSNAIPRLAILPRSPILVMIAAAFCSHLSDIRLYAVAFWAKERARLGRIAGAVHGDHSTISIAARPTSRPSGSTTGEGPMRVTAGIEALNGLILITRSASFTCLAMDRFWPDRR